MKMMDQRGISVHQLKFLAPLLAAPAALLLHPGQANALLAITMLESGSDLIVQASGSLDLSSVNPIGTNQCGQDGLLDPSFAFICTGPSNISDIYTVTGPTSFGSANQFNAASVSGISTGIFGAINQFYIDPNYVNNSPIVSTATFSNTSLTDLQLSSQGPGVIATWSINGSPETIELRIGSLPSSTAVPGPLPLFGAAAAFGWSRKLRRRLTPPPSTTSC